MKKIYVVTGANGHLGGTLVRMLSKRGETVRGLVLPGENPVPLPHVRYMRGDVRDADSMRPLFEAAGGAALCVIHTAGLIDIADEVSERLYDVNVNGTKNVLALCRAYGVERLVYVSSVHAIPEEKRPAVLQEAASFSPERVTGGYAKTKAEATQAVLDAVRDGLDAVVVQPSGIIGPFDTAGNHLVQLIRDYLRGALPACVRGGYDFVDVRDVAAGCLLALENGRRGASYILSNRHYEVKEVLDLVRGEAGGRRLPVLPMAVARAAAPLLQWTARLRGQRPLYTAYSLHTLKSNDRFSHDKATAELGYRPRDLRDTLRDTVLWLRRKQAVPV